MALDQGQAHRFCVYAPEKIAYAVNRYINQAKRLWGVMNKQLGRSKFIACDEYTSPILPFFRGCAAGKNQGFDWADYPHLKKWRNLIAAFPAVQRGVQVLVGLRTPITIEKAWEILFGKTHYEKRWEASEKS